MEQRHSPALRIKGNGYDASHHEGEWPALGDIDDALERAGHEAFTKEPPKTVNGWRWVLLRAGRRQVYRPGQGRC
ncbi:hypothetical protein [Streptomyces zaehneri]|uniref:hypothetical protein n=1 Tax=Streptomyces zaehneri TaxID=3051180 RepID=UPI0028D51565|nr:hypothetical protein [Streptomyces sp. DSM 40713]